MCFCPLSHHDCRYPPECLTLTQIWTQVFAVHQNNDLSAPTSLLILMASIPRKQISGAVFLDASVSPEFKIMLCLWPQFSDGSKKSQYLPFVYLFLVQMSMATSKPFTCWSLVFVFSLSVWIENWGWRALCVCFSGWNPCRWWVSYTQALTPVHSAMDSVFFLRSYKH